MCWALAETRNGKFSAAAVKQFLLTSVFLFFQWAIFFVSAGYVFEDRSWFYFSAALVHYAVSIAVQYKVNPALLVVRLKMKREGSKRWDEVLMRASNLMVIVLIPAVAGLDLRFGWASLDVSFVIVGLVLVVLSSIILNWAMMVNPYFEPTVRIQKERGHKVITNGPYSVVRHPGYSAGILFAVSIPMLIGSIFAFVPVGIYIFFMMLRTWLEDKTLQEELDGYSEYVTQIKHRLFPGIW